MEKIIEKKEVATIHYVRYKNEVDSEERDAVMVMFDNNMDSNQKKHVFLGFCKSFITSYIKVETEEDVVEFFQVVADAIKDDTKCFMKSSNKDIRESTEEIGQLIQEAHQESAWSGTKDFQIWIEGDQTEQARMLGAVNACDFRTACTQFFQGLFPSDTKQKFQDSFNADRLTFVGRHLFDNEEDARKSFG